MRKHRAPFACHGGRVVFPVDQGGAELFHVEPAAGMAKRAPRRFGSLGEACPIRVAVVALGHVVGGAPEELPLAFFARVKVVHARCDARVGLTGELRTLQSNDFEVIRQLSGRVGRANAEQRNQQLVSPTSR